MDKLIKQELDKSVADAMESMVSAVNAASYTASAAALGVAVGSLCTGGGILNAVGSAIAGSTIGSIAGTSAAMVTGNSVAAGAAGGISSAFVTYAISNGFKGNE